MSMSQSSSGNSSYSSVNCCRCWNRSFSSSWNYCPYCGLPINVGVSRGTTMPSHKTTGSFESSHETTVMSVGRSECEGGWTKDIGTSTTRGSDNTSYS